MRIQRDNHSFVLFFAVVLVFIFAVNFVYANGSGITGEDVLDAQANWGNGIVAIGKAYVDDGDYRQVAESLVHTLYAYPGMVLFKPTKAADIESRITKEGAISYFIGGNSEFPEDKGFALKPWVEVRFENKEGIYLY